MRKSSGGFTLIELIVVIVILGILAVTAAPKFMNLQGDAKAASLKGVQAALNSAKSMVYAKSLLKSIEKSATGTVDVNGQTVNTVYGYPKAKKEDLANILDITFDTAGEGGATVAGDYHLDASGDVAHIYIYVDGTSDYSSFNDKCEVKYTQATGADTPATAVAYTTGC